MQIDWIVDGSTLSIRYNFSTEKLYLNGEMNSANDIHIYLDRKDARRLRDEINAHMYATEFFTIGRFYQFDADEVEILECPFCTSKDQPLADHGFEDDTYVVTCHSCLASGPPASNRDDAMILWNERK